MVARLTVWGVLMLSGSFLEAKDLVIHGQVFEIAEKDLLEEIDQKLRRLQKEGVLVDIEKQYTEQAHRSVNRPKVVEGISRAVKGRSWIHDPSIQISKDIKDHKGRIIARAGTLLNPLDTVPFRKTFVFMDGDDEAQIQWLKTSFNLQDASLTLILVKGAPLEMSESLKIPVYFDQGGKLVQQFRIKAVPATVRQEGKKLRIEEIRLTKERTQP